MFRTGTHNPHTLYWTPPDDGPDRFLGSLPHRDAARDVSMGLNLLYGTTEPEWVSTLPEVPKREVA